MKFSIYSMLSITILTLSGFVEAFLLDQFKIMEIMIGFILYLLIAMLISIFLIQRVVNFFGQRVTLTERNRHEFSDKTLVLTAILSAFILIIFVNSNISNFNMLSLAIFSEEYRNSIYKGSGIYTAPMIIALPIVLSYNIIFGKKFSLWFYFSILIFSAGVMILGLRVFLLPLIISLMIRISFNGGITFRVWIITILLILFMSLVKIYLDYDSEYNRSHLEYILNPLLRLNIQYLLNYDFGHGIESIHCLLPFIHQISECDSELIKRQLTSNNPNISFGFPNLSKYSGIAIPLPVYIYNMFGYFSIPFLSLYLFSISILFKILFACHSRFGRLFIMGLLINLSGALFEDYLYIRRIDLTIIASSLLLMIASLPVIKKYA